MADRIAGGERVALHLLRRGEPFSTVGKTPWPRFNATVGIWRPLMPYLEAPDRQAQRSHKAYWGYFDLLMDGARPSLEGQSGQPGCPDVQKWRRVLPASRSLQHNEDPVIVNKESSVRYLPGESNGAINKQFDIFWIMTGRHVFDP